MYDVRMIRKIVTFRDEVSEPDHEREKGLAPGMLLLEGRKSDEFSVKKVYGT